MNHSAFKESVWAYALGALDPSERAECDRHLAEPGPHEGCREALDGAFAAAAELGSSLAPVDPPAGVWGKIASQIAPPSRDRPPVHEPRTSWFPWAVAFAATAACALAVVKGLTYRSAVVERNVQLTQLSAAAAERKQCLRELEALRSHTDAQRATLALLELPSTQLVPLGPTPGQQTPSRGSALFNAEQRKAIVLVSALSPVAGKDYELWILRGKVAINAGLLRPGPDGRSLVQVDPRLLEAGRPDLFAVTLEPEGGSQQPTTTPFLVGTVQKS